MANSGVLNYNGQDGCCCYLPHLTERHLDVLETIAAGKTTAKAAIALNLSEATVKSHIANMMAMAGVHKRAELITLAIAQGILQVQHPHLRTGRACLSPRPPAGLRLQVPAPATAQEDGDGTTVTTVRSG